MSYTKTTWSENDIITADKLNNIEEGVSQSNSVYEIEIPSEALKATRFEPYEEEITDEEYFLITNSNCLSLKVKNTSMEYYLYKNMTLEESNIAGISYANIADICLIMCNVSKNNDIYNITIYNYGEFTFQVNN